MNICSSNPDLSYLIAEDISLIAGDWDAMLPENHPLHSRFLQVFQRAGLPDLRFHYLLISRKGKKVGLAYFQHFHFHSGHYDLKALASGAMLCLTQPFLGQQTSILVCGNLFHAGTEGFYFPDSSDRECILSVTAGLEKKYRAGAVLLKDISADLPAGLLKQNRFRTYPDDQVMSLTLPDSWHTFDDYQSSLSKKYRQRAARILASAAGLRLVRLEEEAIGEKIQEINALYEQVRERQPLRIGSLNGGYFLEMKKAFGLQFEVYAWLDESGKMLAFSSHFLHPDQSREVHYIGFDYKGNEAYALYFNILFHGIRCAIEAGNPKVLFGRTGFDAKASAGAVAVNNLHYFRIRRGLPSITFQLLQKALSKKEADGWKSRNPFRNAGIEPQLQEA
jgi:hypothetical protein